MNPADWQAPLWVVLLGFFVIVMLRANGTYWIGRGIIAGTGNTRWRRALETRAYRRASALINRWGPPAISVSFLFVGVQTMTNLAAGVTRMPLRRYLPAVTVGCMIWALIYGTVGFISWELLIRAWELNPVLTVVVATALLGSLGLWLTLIRVNRRRAGSTPSEAPGRSLVG
ncbi:MAG: VTT domain-containing protein [Arachnia propionica]|uniref:DedA family protein n=1 Tax=Arachnia propionica TaxID=1750 RepID=UPI0026FF4DD7|nr:VTT domain-containing protein [Arachnia propionica]